MIRGSAGVEVVKNQQPHGNPQHHFGVRPVLPSQFLKSGGSLGSNPPERQRRASFSEINANLRRTMSERGSLGTFLDKNHGQHRHHHAASSSASQRGKASGVRRRACEGHSRHWRTRHLAERRAGVLGLHDGRGRLHQNLNWQGKRKRHAAREPGDDPGHPRLSSTNRVPRRLQTCRRDIQGQRCAGVSFHDEGRAGQPLAAAGFVPVWRVQPSWGHRTPTRTPCYRSVLGSVSPSRKLNG